MNKLPIQLWLIRIKWPTLAAGSLLALNALLATLLTLQNKDLGSQRDQLSTLRTRLAEQSSTSPNTTATNSDQTIGFRNILGRTDKIEDYLATLFATADQCGIKLQQGSYRLDTNGAGLYWRYYIELPVLGSFDDIRSFVERYLIALPFSALENIAVSRDEVAQTTVEGKLRFVLFLKPSPHSDSAVAKKADAERR